ncbi:chemotaxis protein CheW [Ectopseudomonas mendocina]|uniref:Chemotaxis protein CheW n=1 Tax=Ectopseudomonas mendocina TaxID=300 RepID=A0ABZ2RID5_ECTME
MSELPGDTQEPQAPEQYLTMMLGQERFALSIEQVREIIEFNGLTEIPLMPDFLRGVINLRGAVVPVLDLSLRLGRERMVVARRTCIVIVEVMQEEQLQLIGVMVDAVNDVLEVRPDQLEHKPSFGAKVRSDFIAGILRHDEQFIVVLDAARVLSLGELAALVGHASLHGA